MKYDKVLLGLPVPLGIPVVVHWSLTTKFREIHNSVHEFHYFQVMLPELLIPSRYIAVLNSRLLDLGDPANSDRAAILNLAKLFSDNLFIIWDQKNLWCHSEGIPNNLLIRRDKTSADLFEYVYREILQPNKGMRFH